jgi:N utilization substance protein A
MPQSIKLTTDEMRLMSLFQSITKVTARDCLDDQRYDRIIFVVNEGNMGLAIGRNGSNIKSLHNILKRNVELVEYFSDPSKFLKHVFNSKFINEIKLTEKADGSSQAIVLVDASKKGLVVGREGRNAERARLFAKRYFGISNVLINNSEMAQFGV